MLKNKLTVGYYKMEKIGLSFLVPVILITGRVLAYYRSVL
jgi:hypothetical protein